MGAIVSKKFHQPPSFPFGRPQIEIRLNHPPCGSEEQCPSKQDDGPCFALKLLCQDFHGERCVALSLFDFEMLFDGTLGPIENFLTD